MKYRIFINFIQILHLSKDKLIEIFNLSWMKWDQAGQVGHGISTALLEERVKIVRHSSCRTSAILNYFCPLQIETVHMYGIYPATL